MPTYYLMALGLFPDGSPVDSGACRLVPRTWGVAIFDWAYVSSEHRMHVPFTVADNYAHSCNLEFAIEAESPTAALDYFRSVNVALLAANVAAFGVPTISTHS